MRCGNAQAGKSCTCCPKPTRLAEAERVFKPDDKLLLIVATMGMHEIETGALGWLSLSHSAARRPASDNVANRSGPRRVDTA